MPSSTATRSARPPWDAIAGLICSSSTVSTRCGSSPDRSAGGRAPIGGLAAGRFGFCMTMPAPVKSRVAPTSLSTLSAATTTDRSSWRWTTSSEPASASGRKYMS